MLLSFGFHGGLTTSVARLVAAIAVGRLGAPSLPAGLVIRGAIPELLSTTTSGHFGSRIDDVRVVMPDPVRANANLAHQKFARSYDSETRLSDSGADRAMTSSFRLLRELASLGSWLITS